MQVGRGLVHPEIQAGAEVFETIQSLVDALLVCTRQALDMAQVFDQLQQAIFIEGDGDVAQADAVERLIAMIRHLRILLRQVKQFVQIGDAIVRQYAAGCATAPKFALIKHIPLTLRVLDVELVALHDLREGQFANAGGGQLERCLIGQNFVAT